MALLAQQQLLEPPPTRRLIVPAGHSAYYGVDPSTRRVSIAYVASDGARGVRTASFPVTEGGHRLAEIWRLTRALAASLAGDWPAPGIVMVEQPSGKQPNPELSYAVGVIIGAIYEGLCATVGSVRVETVASSSWKRRACGRGDIYKPKRAADGEYGVLTWARLNGYDGSLWDEADAWAIAEAARREVALVER